MNDKISRFPVPPSDSPELPLLERQENEHPSVAMIREIYSCLPLIRQMHRRLCAPAAMLPEVPQLRIENPLSHFPNAAAAEKVITDFITAMKMIGKSEFSSRMLVAAFKRAGGIPDDVKLRLSLMLDDEMQQRLGLRKGSKFMFIICDQPT